MVSPDVGGMERAKQLADALGLETVVVHRIRKGPNKCTAEKLLGNVCGQRCLLVDDILDTGDTLVQAATLLKQHGALVVDACVSHAVLSGQAMSTIRSAPIDKIYTTNSIYSS